MNETRTAVVTGASSGIGEATARALAAEGFKVVCAARRVDRIEALAKEIDGVAVACDVTSPESVRGLADAVGGTLHVLVNNAGGAFGSDPVESADPDDWRAMFEVNVIGLLQVTQALLPALRASGDAVIVNMGSTAGRIAYEGGGGYTAAKHGTQVVTETLRLELVGEPIRISEIAPGMVRTDEFALVRFDGDREKAEAVYAGVPEPARRRGHRRRGRLDRDPAQPRQHRRAGDPAARAGRPAQGVPDPGGLTDDGSGHDRAGQRRHRRGAAAEVYDLVSDPSRMGRWSPENLGATVPEAGRPAYVGMSFVGANRRGKIQWRDQVHCDRGRPGRAVRVPVHAIGRRRPLIRGSIATWEYRFEPVADGTRVTEIWTDGRRGWPDAVAARFDRMATGGKLFSEFQQRNIARTLTRMKADLEG